MKIDQLIRTSRRTIAIIVQRNGKVIVRAPLRASQKDIDRFVAEKTDWIEQKLAEFKCAPALINAKKFLPGETYLYLGQPYPLAISNHTRPALELRDNQFCLARSAQPQARDVFIHWYQNQARGVLTAQVEQYARQFNLKYDRLRISSARTRWGSCSTKGTISFTWRLVMAPLPIIDYVVVHELAHLIEHNHSKAFWALVQTMLPDYKARRDWLKKNGTMLSIG